jgi:hypothetical protein
MSECLRPSSRSRNGCTPNVYGRRRRACQNASVSADRGKMGSMGWSASALRPCGPRKRQQASTAGWGSGASAAVTGSLLRSSATTGGLHRKRMPGNRGRGDTRRLLGGVYRLVSPDHEAAKRNDLRGVMSHKPAADPPSNQPFSATCHPRQKCDMRRDRVDWPVFFEESI